jgi:peptide/nickel transport system substrate-binding protein
MTAATLAACTSSSPAKRTTANETLTIAIAGPPTLDPYKANLDLNNVPTVPLAYAPLIRLNADRSYTGDLAKTYGYLDQQNKVFQFKLRPDLKFADGSPLNGEAVVASLQYMLKVSPKAKTWAGTISSITAPDPTTVVVTNKAPNPVMRQLFSQALLSGSIISPAGLADPGKLASQTFGAGPYVLDAANTVANDHYTYTPNQHYWNPSGQYWKKVVVRIIPDSNATVQAIQAKQVDYAALNADAGPAVAAAKLTSVSAGVAVIGVTLADRSGTVNPALKDVRVRQALNYAINREAITKAIFGPLGHPTSQTAAPGFDGYHASQDNRYPFDQAKAKSLLAAAGYPNGFTLKVETLNTFGFIVQAVAAQWKAIGVTVQLTTDNQIPTWVDNVMSRKFPATGFGYGNLPTYLTSLDFMRPTPNPFNPFGSSDAELNAILDRAIAEPDLGKQATLFQQATARLGDLAWFAPVVRMDGLGVMDSRITGMQAAEKNGLPSVLTLRPAN